MGAVDQLCEISKPEIVSQRLKKCAIHRQIAANTITASITIRKRSSNSPRRSLMHVRQSGQGNLNTPIYDRCTSREIRMAEIQSQAYGEASWQKALRLVTQCGLHKRNHRAAHTLTE
jgi:hypothetical protein